MEVGTQSLVEFSVSRFLSHLLQLGETKKAFEALGSALTFDPSNARVS